MNIETSARNFGRDPDYEPTPMELYDALHRWWYARVNLVIHHLEMTQRLTPHSAVAAVLRETKDQLRDMRLEIEAARVGRKRVKPMDEDAEGIFPNDTRTPWRQTTTREQDALAHAMKPYLDRLTPLQAAVIFDLYFVGATERDAARTLGIDRGSVRKARDRALAAMNKGLLADVLVDDAS